jgi:hypothetical protein
MLLCVRTTLEIPDELFRRAKKRAADEDAPFRHVVEAALRLYLAGRTRRANYKLRWRTEQGRLLPGVRLDDRDALFELMEGRS